MIKQIYNVYLTKIYRIYEKFITGLWRIYGVYIAYIWRVYGVYHLLNKYQQLLYQIPGINKKHPLLSRCLYIKIS
jgi:hypothetical protein